MKKLKFPIKLFVLFICCLSMGGCSDEQSPKGTESQVSNASGFQCDDNNGGLSLPEGFCAAIVADNLGFVRHLAVNDNGDIYVTLRNRRLKLGGVLGLRDEDGDGRMDTIEKINDFPGMGIKIHQGHLFFAADVAVYRYSLLPEQLVPPPPEILITGFPQQERHAGKPFALDQHGSLYINIGAVSNACQEHEGVPGGLGLDPCPELKEHAGIWRFADDVAGQIFKADGERYASGIRNAYAIDWQRDLNQLFVTQHGRDELHELWPDLYTEDDGARLPAEEFILVQQGGQYGWPYCYYDQVQNKRVLAPEYGGDGMQSGRCEQYPEPVIAFPGHYGPNDLLFYTGKQFPERFHGGAFVAFHGSYIRGEYEQVGYQVVFISFEQGAFTTDWQVFAGGFAGQENLKSPGDAEYRPTGLAQGPDGSLYISDSVQGRIWRVKYIGGQSL